MKNGRKRGLIEMIEVLKKSIQRIKEQLKQTDVAEIRLGLYMALNSLKNDFTNKDEAFLNELGLDEDLEKYL